MTVTHSRTKLTTVSWLETVTESVLAGGAQRACHHRHSQEIVDDNESAKSALHKKNTTF